MFEALHAGFAAAARVPKSQYLNRAAGDSIKQIVVHP